MCLMMPHVIQNHRCLVNLIGLKANAEGFAVFSAFGFILLTLGALFLDYHSNLPDLFRKVIEEPISLFTFTFLYPCGLLLVLIPTHFGSKTIQLDPKPPAFLRFIAFPISRAGGSAGSVASGMLVGMALGLMLLSQIYSDNSLLQLGRGLLALGIFLLAILIPFTLFFFYAFSAGQKWILWLDAFSALCLGAALYVIYQFNDYYDWLAVASCIALLISFLLARKL